MIAAMPTSEGDCSDDEHYEWELEDALARWCRPTISQEDYE
jgi:hypothetical protein